MLIIEKVDTTSKKQVERFVNLPYRLYANHHQWVPPLLNDAKLYLNRRKHFFYEHSQADFFIAQRAGRDVGRIAALDHRRYNDHHGTRQAQFYFFDCEDDAEAATALFEQAFTWAKNRNLNRIIGPKGFGTLDPFGILIKGFEHRQMMTMSNYNYPYYQTLVEAVGFTKEVDFNSCYLNTQTFQLPDWLRKIATQTRQKGELRVENLGTFRQAVGTAPHMIRVYNQAMVNNWEYYSLTEREISEMVNTLKFVTNLNLPKFITHQGEMVGLLFVLPDLSPALQRAKGRLTPWSAIDIFRTVRRPQGVVLAGMGILPEFRLQGGTALIFAELEKNLRDNPNIQHAELHQVADTAEQVWQDLKTFGIKPYKIHRVYQRHL